MTPAQTQRPIPSRTAVATRRTAAFGALGGGLRKVPRAAWLCAMIACLNAACWSILSPPFQIVDEPSHFAYAQTLAETGRLPVSDTEAFSPAEDVALVDLHYGSVFFRPKNEQITSQPAQRILERDLALPLDRAGSGAAGAATAEPPLYYALEAVPYLLASGGTVLDQLALMRLLSALMGGVTALFAFLFIREALPEAPWAWTVGGLGVGLAPLLAMMSGSVNPDALCFAVSAALFYGLARGFRRGLTPRLAAAIGAVVAVGCLSKLNFLGLLPGAFLGLLVLCARVARSSRRAAIRSFAIAVGVAAAAALPYALFHLLSDSPAFGPTSDATGLLPGHGSSFRELEYIWQLFLPRLPGMHAYFHGVFTTRVLWFNGLVGIYGWLDTTFPAWVYDAALLPAALIAILLARALVQHAGALRTRLSEATVYLTMSLGMLAIVGAGDYASGTPGEFREPRYLLPMVSLWGAMLALTARGAGRRWGPVAGTLIVLLFLAHDIFSQLLVISRFYG